MFCCLFSSINNVVLLLILLVLFSIRLFYYVINLGTPSSKHNQNIKTLICMGSGGHTAEMIRILSNMDFSSYSPRLYLMAITDETSEGKVKALEKTKTRAKDFSIGKIRRSRHVLQSYFSSVWTTLHSFVTSIPIVYSFKPDIIICNGPGTCVPICFIAIMLNLLYVTDCKIMFVESICRVRSLSLTGKILYNLSDIFVVQWKSLQMSYSGSKYFGRLS